MDLGESAPALLVLVLDLVLVLGLDSPARTSASKEIKNEGSTKGSAQTRGRTPPAGLLLAQAGGLVYRSGGAAV